MGRPALAIGGLALIAVGGIIAFGWWSPSTTSTADRQLTQPIDTVSLDVGSGNVHVRTADVGTTTIHESFHYRGSLTGDAFAVTGTRLQLTGCGAGCTVDYDVVVPPGTTVTGQANSGDVTAQGLAGTDVTTRSGEVRVLAAAGPVTVHANSGDVTVVLAQPEDVLAQASSGDVNVTVPPERYRLQVQTHSGDQHVGIANDPAGTHVLNLQANSGDIRVSQSA